MSDSLYKGTFLTTKAVSEKFGLDPYLPSDKLIKAVQLAQKLGRPLPVKGEPGCGKSRLAVAIAAELNQGDCGSWYFEWNVKSTSKAQDGLYTIDYLRRLQDAQLKTKQSDVAMVAKKDESGNYYFDTPYLALGALGRAFQATHKQGGIPVVLIDEIDKADIDFPNDLLLELERMEFSVPEAENGQDKKMPVVIKANPNSKPVVIITSNDEKQLPAAFLRRCLFHYIDFTEIKLKDILDARFPNLEKQETLIAEAIKAFLQWRETISTKMSVIKNISTSELLDWFSLLYQDLKEGKELPPFAGDKLPPYYQALLKETECVQYFVSKEKPLQEFPSL